MKLSVKVSKTLTLLGLLLAGFIVAGSARAQLTPTGVEKFLIAIEDATDRRDVSAVVDALADDVIILFRFSSLGDIPDMRFTKTEYGKFLAAALASIEAHSARRFGTKITISDDGTTAEVFANVEETTTVQGKTTVHTSQQTVLIVVTQDGRMLVKRVFAEVLQQANDT